MLWQAFGRWGGIQGTSDGGGGIVNDPYFSNVVLLLSGDGSNGSQVFTDESPSAHGNAGVVGGGNSVQVSTAVKKFGSGSIRFDGDIDGFTYGGFEDFNFADQPFTIDAWVYYDTAKIESNQTLLSLWRSTDNNRAWQLTYAGSATPNALSFSASADGTGTTVTATGTFEPVADTWYLHSIDRSASDVFRVYVDGVMIGSATNALSIFDPATIFRAGHISSGGVDTNFFHGNMDEIRITKGVARYASDGGFSVPTAAFPRS